MYSFMSVLLIRTEKRTFLTFVNGWSKRNLKGLLLAFFHFHPLQSSQITVHVLKIFIQNWKLVFENKILATSLDKHELDKWQEKPNVKVWKQISKTQCLAYVICTSYMFLPAFFRGQVKNVSGKISRDK